MRKFVVIHPYSSMPHGLYPIDCDPSLKYEVYIFAKKETICFEEIIDIYLRPFNRNDYLGAMSLVYFKYYDRFYDFLLQVSKDEELLRKYKRATVRFYKKYLKRWISFIRHSDDTMYPQNEVFRNMEKVVIDIIKKR